MSRGDLSEVEWRLLKDLLPPERGRKSRPAHDNRPIVNGILWRIRTGAPWRDLPEKYGKWMTVYQRFRRWSEAGIWEAVASAVTQAMADNRHHSIDSTTVRGHPQAAGAKGGLANRLLAARGAGSPVKFVKSHPTVTSPLGGAKSLMKQLNRMPGWGHGWTRNATPPDSAIP